GIAISHTLDAAHQHGLACLARLTDETEIEATLTALIEERTIGGNRRRQSREGFHLHLAFDAMRTCDRTDQDHVVFIRSHEADESTETRNSRSCLGFGALGSSFSSGLGTLLGL